MNPMDASQTLAADAQGSTAALRQLANQNSPQALKTVAGQFESLFVEMMLKSMRDATPQDGVFDSQQTRLFTSMLDQQLSQNLAKRGIGLADMLVRQLSPGHHPAAGRSLPPVNPVAARQMVSQYSAQAGLSPSSGAVSPEESSLRAGGSGGLTPASRLMQAFKSFMAPHAAVASAKSGIPAQYMLGQAALESGWGSHEVVSVAGEPSHNLFGIKAGAGWHGKTVLAETTEYVNGVAQHKLARFRAYDSYADSFSDYASLLTSNPRFSKVLQNIQTPEQFAHAVQNAGYATDPQYAAKLVRVIQQASLA